MAQTHINIALLYLKTGAGHINPCKAIMQDIEMRYGSHVRVHLVNPFAVKEVFFSKLIEKSYNIMTNYIPFLWRIIYDFSSFAPITATFSMPIIRLYERSLRNYIHTHNITCIINAHFLLNTICSHIVNQSHTPITLYTLVTDPFSAHPLWCHKNSGSLLLLSNNAKEIISSYQRNTLLLKGLYNSYQNMQIVAPIIASQFRTRLSQEAINACKTQQKLHLNRPCIMFLGGGEGLPQGPAALEQVCQSPIALNIIYTAGKNTRQYKKALQLQQKYYKHNIRVYGFIDNIYEMMNCADIVLTKAGTSAIFELLSLRIPPVIITYIYGQEYGTVKFIEENKLGIYIKKRAQLTKQITYLLQNPNILNAMQQNIAHYNTTVFNQSSVADIIIPTQ